MNSRLLIRTSLSVVAILALWFGWWAFGRSPEAEVRAAQTAFLTAVEDRDWKEVSSYLETNYTDAYGHTRESAIENAKKALGLFYVLEIKSDQVSVKAAPQQAMLQCMLRLEGNGAGMSQSVMDHANRITTPWMFHWSKAGVWPWTWQVTMIHNDSVR